MTGASVVVPWPGTDQHDAQAAALGALADVPEGVRGLPPLLRLPARGPWWHGTSRLAALLVDLPSELGPHGWRLADRGGRDVERARAALREDLDVLAVTGYGYTGPLVLPLLGPWTAAATLYLARGDRVLGDPGAVRDLVASLGEAVAGLVTSVRGAVPGAEPVVVLREPSLPDVLLGAVRTFSGHGRLRSIPAADAARGLEAVVGQARAVGASVVVDTVGAFDAAAFTVARRCGAEAVGVVVGTEPDAAWEHVATAVEAGTRCWFGVPTASRGPAAADVAAGVVTPWRAVGLPAAALRDVVLNPRELGASGAEARRAVARTVEVAARVADHAEAG